MTERRPDATGNPSDPAYDGFRISELWAFTAVDPEDDQEGIPAFDAGGVAMPMVCSDRVRVDQLRPIAQAIADQTGMTFKLSRFVNRVDEDTIYPSVDATGVDPLHNPAPPQPTA